MEEISAGKEICSFLEKKRSLLKRYLSTTKRIKETFKEKKISDIDRLVSERQDCIKKIDNINISMKKVIKIFSKNLYTTSDRFRCLIDGSLKDIRNIMETIAPLDREVLAMVKQEGESIKNELLNMRDVRHAARGYKIEGHYSPRFLDMKR